MPLHKWPNSAVCSQEQEDVLTDKEDAENPGLVTRQDRRTVADLRVQRKHPAKRRPCQYYIGRCELWCPQGGAPSDVVTTYRAS